MRSRFLIYALVDPRSGEIRYIGKSCKGMGRPKEHGRPWQRTNDRTHKGNWVREVTRLNIGYLVMVLQDVRLEESSRLCEFERDWIAYGRSEGWPLTNFTDGGDGQVLGYKPSAEARARVSAALKGRKKSPEVRARMKAAAKSRCKACKAIVDVGSGVRYNSLQEAADSLGLRVKSISQVLRGQRKRTHGHRFEYALLSA